MSLYIFLLHCGQRELKEWSQSFCIWEDLICVPGCGLFYKSVLLNRCLGGIFCSYLLSPFDARCQLLRETTLMFLCFCTNDLSIGELQWFEASTINVLMLICVFKSSSTFLWTSMPQNLERARVCIHIHTYMLRLTVLCLEWSVPLYLIWLVLSWSWFCWILE